MKIFVDTNIFLDLVLKRKDYSDSLLILNSVEKKLFSAFILDITILNIDYVAKKQIKDVKEFLRHIVMEFNVIGATNEMINHALEIDNNDLEDSLQYVSAKKLNCDLIITNDKNFYTKGISILSSNEFVNQYLR